MELTSSKTIARLTGLSHGEVLAKIDRIKKAVPAFQETIRESKEPNKMNAYFRVCYLTHDGLKQIRDTFKSNEKRQILDDYMEARQ